MSPEVLNGGEFSFENDIWSFGVVLYELLVFQHPFQGDSTYDVMDKIVNSDFNPFPDGIPSDITNLLTMMLNKNPYSRIVLNDIEKVPSIIQYFYDSDQLIDLGWKAFYGISGSQR